MKDFLYLLATDQKNGIIASIIKFLLWILSGIYLLVILIRNWFYKIGILKSRKVSCPVISVGNITLGGTGKTPLVQLIAQHIVSKNKNLAILLRGYTSSVDQLISDEAMLLQNKLQDVSVLVGADRYANASEYLKENKCDVFLLDDGFQHRKMSRDLDIVAINTLNPWGNKQVLPRGILRESLNSLKRADILAITKSNLKQGNVQKISEKLKLINPKALIIQLGYEIKTITDFNLGDRCSLESLAGRNVVLFSGIGDPNSLELIAQAAGTNIKKYFQFVDHHHYQEAEIKEIIRYCQQHKIDTVITTQKDAVKLDLFKRLFKDSIRLLVLGMDVTILNGKEDFFGRIDSILLS